MFFFFFVKMVAKTQPSLEKNLKWPKPAQFDQSIVCKKDICTVGNPNNVHA